MSYYLNALGVVNALGHDKASVLRNMLAGSQENIQPNTWVPDKTTYTAMVAGELPSVDGFEIAFKSRNNQLALHALNQIQNEVGQAIEKYGSERVAVVIGTSTSGVSEGENAIIHSRDTGVRPENYSYQQQEMGSVSEFVAHQAGVTGPAYTISTACSSSAHALASAKRLLAIGMVDAVIAGGADSMCRLTVNGFAALESVSDEITNPFSQNRKGINIGEGASLFLVTKEPGGEAVELLGVGASSDAHHISAPEPSGSGAEKAIKAAILDAGIELEQVDYVNLHGTGTRLNDAMESKVVARLFGSELPCSSSKGQLGHTLGAAAANEVALCWLCLSSLNTTNELPPHLWDGERDSELPTLNLVQKGGGGVSRNVDYKTDQIYLSNSFAFGGNNAAVIVGRRRD